MDKKLRETHYFRWRNDEQQTTSKDETWSRGTNSRLPFDVNVMLNLSITDNKWLRIFCEFDKTVSTRTNSH